MVGDVLKQTKYGRGQPFLPRSTDDLFKNLEYLQESGVLKDKLRAIIDELYQREEFSYEDYNTLQEECSDNQRFL